MTMGEPQRIPNFWWPRLGYCRSNGKKSIRNFTNWREDHQALVPLGQVASPSLLFQKASVGPQNMKNHFTGGNFDCAQVWC